MTLAIGVNALPGIVKTIAAGLTERWKTVNFKPLNIIICENILNAKQFFEELIIQELTTDKLQIFRETIGLVETSVGRMVPLSSPGMQLNKPLLVCVEEYCGLSIDKDAFEGEIPEISNLKPFSTFNYYVQSDLYMHNTCFIRILFCHFRRKWFSAKTLYQHAKDLLSRFSNRGLADTVVRVGRDPARKLSKNDRIVGAWLLFQKHGIKPVFISVGIAAGLLFAQATDE